MKIYHLKQKMKSKIRNIYHFKTITENNIKYHLSFNCFFRSSNSFPKHSQNGRVYDWFI